MEVPKNLSYSKDHEWISNRNGTAKVGITSFAVEQLGDIVHVDLPGVGESFKAGDSFGTVESTKTVSDLIMPAGGKIVEINDGVCDEPESLQKDSYRDGWLIKIEIAADSGAENLLDADAYEDLMKQS